MRRCALLLLAAAAPALAFAQAEGATGDPARPLTDRPDLFRPVPSGPDGRPLQYRPPAPPPPEMETAPGARLRLLDKMTGQVETFEMQSGETRLAARLVVTLGPCRSPVGAAPDAVAWLEVRDVREAEARFRGWMFASSPALSALDHARWDLWVISCSAASGEASAGSE